MGTRRKCVVPGSKSPSSLRRNTQMTSFKFIPLEKHMDNYSNFWRPHHRIREISGRFIDQAGNSRVCVYSREASY